MASTTSAFPVQRRKKHLESRAYQLELFEYAKEHNVCVCDVWPSLWLSVLTSFSTSSPQVVIYLDTGSGKTFVSVLLIRHEHAVAAARHAAGTGPQPLAIFMAPTVALVEQQYSVLKNQLDLRVSRCVNADLRSTQCRLRDG